MLRLLLVSCFLLAWVASLPLTASAAQLGKGVQAKLDRALAAAKAETRAPGVVAGVWIGNRGWTGTLGTTRRGGHEAPTLAEHTRIGSVTKTFTGTLVLQLVAAGKLELDEPIEPWFPQLPDAGAITIRELGEMSSGINSYTANEAVVDRYLEHPEATWKPSELIAAGVGMPRLFPPGDGFFYSNTNTQMLGQIVEEVTGEPLGAAMRKRIFGPLKMTGTSYPASNRLPAPHWNGYTEQGAARGEVLDATRWNPTFAGAAGQIVSTLGDLHRYTRALGTGSLLTPSLQEARLEPNRHSIAGGRRYDFALVDERGWLGHSGELPGYNTQIGYMPGKKATIVVLTNADIPDRDGAAPAPSIFRALTKVVTPRHVPASR